MIQEQIEALNHELTGVLNGSSAPVTPTAPEAEPDAEPLKTRKKYKLSAAGRAKKVAALKARFAKVKAPDTEAEPVERRKSKFSAAGLARLYAAQKARWAKFHAEKAGKSEKK